MENPSRLEENMVMLLRQMKALKEIRDAAARRNERGKYDGLIKHVQIMETEVAEILSRKTFLDKKFGSLSERRELNKRVISSMREIGILVAQFEIDDEEEATIIDDETEARISNLTILLRFSVARLNKYTFGFSTLVGKGAFGNVYQGQFPTGVQIAVKVIDEKDVSENTFMAELEAIYKCNHQNLIQLYGFCYEKTMKALVYDYMEKGSLDAVLYENRHNIKWDKLYSIATETAKGIAYLHDGCTIQTIHHDMKPANILLDSRLSPKITDFGLAKIMAKDVNDFTLSRIKGTPGYVAPEISVHYGKVTSKSDVYSFGMLLFEILRRRRHYENDDGDSDEWFPEKVWRKFNNGQLDEILEECDIAGEEDIEKARVLSAVALWCVQHTVKVRPSMSVVVYMLENVMQVTAPPNPFVTTDSGDSMRPAHSHVARSTVIPIVTESLREQKDLKNAEDLIPRNFASSTNWNPSRSKDSVILFTDSKYFIDKFHAQSLSCEDETWKVMMESDQPSLLILKGKYIGKPITDQRLNEKRSQEGGNFIHEASSSNLESIQENEEESKECSASKKLENPK